MSNDEKAAAFVGWLHESGTPLEWKNEEFVLNSEPLWQGPLEALAGQWLKLNHQEKSHTTVSQLSNDIRRIVSDNA
jgi:hypothetical protein